MSNETDGIQSPSASSSEASNVELHYSPLDATSKFSVPAERHPQFELIYVEKGTAQKMIGANRVESRPGHVFFIPPDSFHRHGDPSHQATWSLRFHVDAVDGHVRGLLAALAIRPAQSRCYMVPETDRLRWEERLRYLRYELHAMPSHDADAVRVILRSILLDVGSLAHLEQSESLRKRGVLTRVFQFIDERYRYPIGLGDVASAVQLSPAYLTDLVRRETGKPIHQWITDRRMYAARILLAQTDSPVADVADEVGFSDSSYFSRQFCKIVGKTPRAWRVASRRLGAANDFASPWNQGDLVDDTLAKYQQVRKLSEELTTVKDADLIVRRAVTTAFDVLKPTMSQFVERSLSEKRWRPRFAVVSEESQGEFPEANDADGVLPLVLAGQTIVTLDLARSPSPLLRQIGHYGFTSSMIAPVRLESECIGAIRVLERNTRAFSEPERVTLAMIGSLTGLALRSVIDATS